MLAPNHQQAALDIESTIPMLLSNPTAGRVIIEAAWGAAFHWIAFGCDRFFQRHQDNHTRLGTFIRALYGGTSAAADAWDSLDRLRQGGWYGNSPQQSAVQLALQRLEEIRLWATT